MAQVGDVQWTEEMMKFLEDLYVNTKMSNQEMADELNQRFRVGASRNAVIGKISRMGVGKRHVVVHRMRQLNRGRPKKEKPLAEVIHSMVEIPAGRRIDRSANSRHSRVGVEALKHRRAAWGKVPALPANFNAAEITSPNPVSLEDIGCKQCHWPLGGVNDKPPYMYCGNTVVDGKSYCLSHCWLERRIK